MARRHVLMKKLLKFAKEYALLLVVIVVLVVIAILLDNSKIMGIWGIIDHVDL